MKTPETWMLVADGAEARLFRIDRPEHRLELLKEKEWARSREKTSEIVSDRQGRAFSSAGPGQRSGMEPHTDPQRYEKEQFARELAEMLREAVVQGQVERLVLVAAPRTLGDLRAALAAPVAERVALEIDKDLVRLDQAQLEKQLGSELFGPS